jgi:hypothetical protein
MKAEKRHGRSGQDKKHEACDQQRVDFTLARSGTLLDGVEEWLAQRFHKGAVTRTLVNNKEARTRLLRSDELKLWHQSTAVALIGWLPSLPKTN